MEHRFQKDVDVRTIFGNYNSFRSAACDKAGAHRCCRNRFLNARRFLHQPDQVNGLFRHICSGPQKAISGLALCLWLGAAGPAQPAEPYTWSHPMPKREITSKGMFGPVVFSDTNEARPQKAARVLDTAITTIPADLSGIAMFPIENFAVTAAAVAGVGALMLVDRQTTEFWQDNIEPRFQGFSLPRISNQLPAWLGAESQWILAGIAGTYAYGIAANDERAQAAATMSAKAIAYSYVTSQLVLKPLFGRNRPVDGLSSFIGDPGDFTTNPFDFGNRQGIPFRPVPFGTALPSFHVTQYFAVARVYSGVYDNSLLPYAVAGLLTVSNISGHNHWVSDMVAGGLVGFAIGSVVLSNYNERRNGQFSVVPSVSSDSVGLTATMSF
ncbi:MAG: phosphatase PAP2 family protein [Pseudomonadota bacterium]|nr:phosphatase PAP2 family protein [Pseudomonadota bacterium]